MRTLAISIICGALIGCASTTVSRSPGYRLDPKVSVRHDIFVWGFWEKSPPIQANQICGAQNWSAVRTHYSILNILVGAATAGIYTPVTVDVHCSDLQSRK